MRWKYQRFLQDYLSCVSSVYDEAEYADSQARMLAELQELRAELEVASDDPQLEK